MKHSLRSEGIIFILSSPSGGGKSSLSNGLLKSTKNLKMSISVTTREPRPGEVDGVDYFFKTIEEFNELAQQKLLLESTKIYNNYYGTPIEFVKEQLDLGQDLLIDIDSKGFDSFVDKLADKIVSIFILPPSLPILSTRLTNRGQDSAEVIKYRLESAKEEMKQAINYDYVIINEIFTEALDTIQSIVKSERAKKLRQNKLSEFLQNF